MSNYLFNNLLDSAKRSNQSATSSFIPPLSLLSTTNNNMTPLIDKKNQSSKENLLISSSSSSGVGTAASMISSTISQQQQQQQQLQSTDQQSIIYIALYDYLVNLNKHLNMHKGDQLYVLSYNKTKEWSEVRNVQSGQVGWVPTSYIKPYNSLENYLWYHGRIERVKAEYLLSSGINGSFLVRESETCLNQLSISLRWEGRVYHYRINRDETNTWYFVSKDSKFLTLPDLIQVKRIFLYSLIC